jgi:Na+-translocating ferredoxin:NAD+ oxidoreductase RnfC subunit
MLKQRLDLRRYDRPAPHRRLEPPPDAVTVPHRQHAGVAGRPLLRAGQAVAAGDVLADVAPDALGVPVHAPFAGTVREVDETATLIERG